MPRGEAGPAVERVASRLPAGAFRVLADELSPADLQTLLLEVAHARAARVTPARLMQRWQQDRFVAPASADPRALSALEARLWALLPEEFVGLELSPLTPLGTCAAVDAADQNRVVSTVHTSEVVSDPTNVLALEAARRRRDHPGPVHLAAAHRVVRAQQFGPGFSPHFRLFALVSSARDTGAGRTEAALLRAHLSYWFAVLRDQCGPGGGAVEYTVFPPALGAAVRDVLATAVAQDRLVEAADRTRARSYYTSLAIRIVTATGAELGDGGTTDWTARLRADAKERCLISCISTERLLAAGAG